MVMSMLRLDVIGDPIEHSKSPLIHGTALDSLGIPYEYRKIRVAKGGLKEYINEAKGIGISGFNLTMPHKVDIIPFLDFIDDEAKSFNSVNTVRIKSGRLYGYNTDGKGFTYAMAELGVLPENKNIVILGAGGVVSTLALKMQLEGAKSITILNRTLSAAENIADKLSISAQALPLTTESISSAVQGCDILVNATPLGMEGIDKDFEDLSFIDSLKYGALVYDLIYNPTETSLLKAAKARSFDTLNGMAMLIYQGLLADEIFLDQKLSLAPIKDKIEIKLKNFKK